MITKIVKPQRRVQELEKIQTICRTGAPRCKHEIQQQFRVCCVIFRKLQRSSNRRFFAMPTIGRRCGHT